MCGGGGGDALIHSELNTEFKLLLHKGEYNNISLLFILLNVLKNVLGVRSNKETQCR